MPYPFFVSDRKRSLLQAKTLLINLKTQSQPHCGLGDFRTDSDNVAFTPSIPSDSIKVKSCWATIVSIMATPDKSMYSLRDALL